MVMFCAATDVRGYLNQNATTGLFSTTNIENKIKATSAILQRETRRLFEKQDDTTKNLTTGGASVISLPDLRTLDSLTLNGTALVVTDDYVLESDPTGLSTVKTSVTLRAPGYSTGWYPGDLVAVGDWGHDPYPDELVLASTILAAYETIRPNSLLANVTFTPEGAVLNYRAMPPEVRDFIDAWRIHPGMVVVGG